MTQKKVSYINLLKEAIKEFDNIGDTVDIKGPMLDTILAYRGDGELETSKDAASILERYYFEENQDPGVAIEEEGPIDNAIDEVPDKNIEKTKKDIEKAVTEQEEEKEEEGKEEEEEIEEQKEEGKEEEKEEDLEESDLENAIVEKLIAEMESEILEDENKGAGTEAAGTGGDEKEIPDRKDKGEGFPVKAAEVKEQEEEDLDVDEEMEKGEELEEAEAGGEHGPGPSAVEDEEEKELEEAFKIFKEQIEEEVEEIDSDKVRV